MNVNELSSPTYGKGHAERVATAMDNLYDALREKDWDNAAALAAVNSYFKGGLK